jgi:uncharacterized membrane protein (UPF0136 family)
MTISLLLFVYAALIAVGGLIAFVRTKSKVSAIVGGIIAAILLLCGFLAQTGFQAGAYIGFVLTLLMTALFGLRYQRKKLRSAALMMVISLLAAGGMAYLLVA